MEQSKIIQVNGNALTDWGYLFISKSFRIHTKTKLCKTQKSEQGQNC